MEVSHTGFNEIYSLKELSSWNKSFDVVILLLFLSLTVLLYDFLNVSCLDYLV